MCALPLSLTTAKTGMFQAVDKFFAGLNIDGPLLLSAATEATEKSGASGPDIHGPMVVAQFELFGIVFNISTSIVVQWIVLFLVGILLFSLGRNLKVKPESKRQVLAEMAATAITGMVNDSMGPKYKAFASYIGGLFCFSLFLSLSTLLGFRPPTSDISVIATWGILTFILVQTNRFRTGGLIRGVKSLTEPIWPMTGLNIIGEFAGPFAQTCRHYANIIAGVIIGAIIYWALGLLLVPVLIPSFFSLYFDIFASVVQAFIFCTLTMVYVSMGDCSKPEPEQAQ